MASPLTHSPVHEDDGDNHSVQSNGFGENQQDDHTNEDTISLGVGSDTGISGNTNGESSGKGGKSAAESGCEVLISLTGVDSSSFGNLKVEEHGNNEAVDTQDTRHNDWDQGLNDLRGVNNTEGGNTDAGLGGSVGGTEVGEDQAGHNTHVGEEIC